MTSENHGVVLGDTMIDTTRLNAMNLQRIAAILKACGVAEGHGSPQIYAHPESIHIIAPRDLQFLVSHADVVATHRDLRYDVCAFTGILWGMIQNAERSIEKVLRSDEANGPAATEGAGAGHAGSTSSSSPSSPPLRSFVYTNTSNVYLNIYPHLVQVVRVTALLRAFESPNARREVRNARRIAQVDVEVVARLAARLTQLFLGEAGEHTALNSGSAEKLNVTAAYSNFGHLLFRTTESALGSVALLLASLSARPGGDVGPILRYFNDDNAWRASALGLLITESYGLSIQTVLFSLLQRRRDFDNLEEVVSKLFLRRLACRPPYQWRTFRLLYFSVQDLSANDPRAAENQQGSSAYGQLLMFRCVQRVIQRCLTTEGSSITDELTTVKALRKAVKARANRAWLLQESAGGAAYPKQEVSAGGRSSLLSYYELLVLSALQGMPQVDLTKDAELLRRAEQTGLSTEPEVLNPSFLRLLMVSCYTIPAPADAGCSHALLTTPSTLALYESLSEHVLQIKLCSSAAHAEQVNPLFSNAALQIEAYVHLCLLNAVHNTREDEQDRATAVPANEKSGDVAANPAVGHLAPPSGSANGIRLEAGVPLFSSTPVRSAGGSVSLALSSLPSSPTPLSALFHRIRRDVSLLFSGNADVLQHTPEAARVRAKNFPQGFRVMTLTAVKHLFGALRTADLFHYIPPADMMPVVAQLFALRAYYPLSLSATEKDLREARHLVSSLRNTLALLPQEMKVGTVNDLLRRVLVPMSTTAAHVNQLQLALFEAYLRAMATASAANAVADELMLEFWVDIAVPAITNPHSVSLANAGHDFLIAAFRAEKYVSPLFVPTYISLYAPSAELFSAGRSTAQGSAYSPLSVAAIQHFARMVRTACYGIERCDSTALARLFDEDSGAAVEDAMPAPVNALRAYVAKLSPEQRDALRKVTPISAVLLVVSALFEWLCLLWNNTPGYVNVAQDLFMAYFSGLCHLLQCTSTPVLQRVCASIEALEVEHLRGSGSVQLQFLKYVSSVVDSVQAPSKVGIAEWYLKMSRRINEQNFGKHSKL